MATVLEDCTNEEQRSVERYLWTEGLNAKVIRKEMFPDYDGKSLLSKAVHIWVTKFFQGRSKVADDADKLRRQQSKDFYIAGFDALVKRWDNCINVGGGYVEK
jgi:hypothetical protein